MQVIEQPDGKLCIFSAETNEMLLKDANDQDVILFLIDRELHLRVSNIIERTKDLITSARHNKEPLHEYFLTYEEAVLRVKEKKDGINMRSNEKSNPNAKKEALKRAEELGCKLNPDENTVNKIVNALTNQSINYGKMYCPCTILKNEDTVCCCKEWKEAMEKNSMKYCHCKLYVNPNFCKE